MGPAIGHGDRVTTRPGWFGQPIISGVSIYLQDAVEADQELFSIFASSVRRVKVDRLWRIITAPVPVVAGQCPEIASFGTPTPGVDYGGCRFIHEELRGHLQMFGQPVDDRREMEACQTHPICQRGSVNVDAGSSQDLALSV